MVKWKIPSPEFIDLCLREYKPGVKKPVPKVWKCNRCSTELKRYRKYCPECSEKVKAERYIRNLLEVKRERAARRKERELERIARRESLELEKKRYRAASAKYRYIQKVLESFERACRHKSRYRDVFEQREAGMTYREIAEKRGVTRQRIQQICTGR